MGYGLDPVNVLGPLQNARQFDIVKHLVEDAITRAGRVVLGGASNRSP
jgi:acyl-CoA reductase-like NAD-dependent aldehyde dehydrogenase